MQTLLRTSATFIVVCVVSSGLARAQAVRSNPTGAPADLDTVIAVFMRVDSTSIEKERLNGRRYSGWVTIEDVVASGEFVDKKPRADIIVHVKSADFPRPNVKMSFSTLDVESTLRLRKGDKVRVTGRLVGTRVSDSAFRGRPSTEYILFVDSTVEKAHDGPH